jgi:hypothetical protein
MPEYLISNQSEISKYARVDAKGIAFVDQDLATGYATPEAARKAFDERCEELWEKAKKKGAQALADRKYVETDYGQFVKPEDLGKNRWNRGGKSYKHVEAAFAPSWLVEAKKEGRRKAIADFFPVASRATSDDLLGVHDLFYLCSEEGWLGRPKRKGSEGRLEFAKNFAMAVSFTSREAAAAEMAKGIAYGRNVWVVKSSCAFTMAEPLKEGSKAFDAVAGIAAACEAREIRSSLEASVADRLEAMKAAEAVPRANKQRL